MAAAAGLPWRLPGWQAVRDQRYASPVDIVDAEGVLSKCERDMKSVVGVAGGVNRNRGGEGREVTGAGGYQIDKGGKEAAGE